jgi:hypothetical protein
MDNPWWRKRHLGPHTVRVRVALDEFESLPFDEVVSLVDWFETHPVAPERLTPELLADAPLLRVFATIQDSLRDIWGTERLGSGWPPQLWDARQHRDPADTRVEFSSRGGLPVGQGDCDRGR